MTRSIAKIREDGLAIFEDANDPILNEIRRAADRKSVILAVAIRRAQQIALGYAAKYAPDIYTEVEAKVRSVLPASDGVLPALPERIDTTTEGRR
ncbi:hypothetical protein HY522_06085 [bacterium]|nr:hypothetical protein [bacterium]